MNILITGGSGYIGSYLTKKLLAKGHRITSVDLEKPRNSQDLSDGSSRFNFISGDVVHPKNIEIDYRSFDVVIPLAAIVGRKQCELNPTRAYEVNHKAIGNLTELLGPDQLLIFPQTNMGFLHDQVDKPGVFDDNSDIQPVSSYVKTKILGEEMALNHGRAISLRLSSVFGVSVSMKDHLLLNFMVKEAIERNKINLYEPEFLRSFVSLNDLSNLIEQIFLKDSTKLIHQKINVSDPRLNITKFDLANRIQRATGCEVSITTGSDPDMRNYIIKSSLTKEFGFEYESDFESEIKLLSDYYRSEFHP
jgi:nucleoside-diphosphate-sugar epimerase